MTITQTFDTFVLCMIERKLPRRLAIWMFDRFVARELHRRNFIHVLPNFFLWNDDMTEFTRRDKSFFKFWLENLKICYYQSKLYSNITRLFDLSYAWNSSFDVNTLHILLDRHLEKYYLTHSDIRSLFPFYEGLRAFAFRDKKRAFFGDMNIED